VVARAAGPRFTSSFAVRRCEKSFARGATAGRLKVTWRAGSTAGHRMPISCSRGTGTTIGSAGSRTSSFRSCFCENHNEQKESGNG
jgi:hypothetical protein